MKQITIQIATTNGKKDVQAYPTACPHLFVHKALPTERFKGWVITHRLTGYNIYYGIETMTQAKKACTILASIPNAHWEVLTPKTLNMFIYAHKDTLAQALGVLKP